MPLAVACLVASGGYAVWFMTGKGRIQTNTTATKTSPPIPVLAEPAKKTDFRILITGIGTVVPLHTVVIKSRVDGQLIAVFFKEGQVVKQGDLPRADRSAAL
jgi:multidrug efflux system membrane fusion protein